MRSCTRGFPSDALTSFWPWLQAAPKSILASGQRRSACLSPEATQINRRPQETPVCIWGQLGSEGFIVLTDGIGPHSYFQGANVRRHWAVPNVARPRLRLADTFCLQPRLGF